MYKNNTEIRLENILFCSLNAFWCKCICYPAVLVHPCDLSRGNAYLIWVNSKTERNKDRTHEETLHTTNIRQTFYHKIVDKTIDN